ncbi:MAG: hypothetical protein RJB66_2416 [Pseudomonadota bacterium]
MHDQFMKRAIELSREHMNANHGGPFGAVIVKDGIIIAEGWNNVTSSNDPTAHAEVSVIRKACEALKTFELIGCEIYTSCEPCPMCLAAIYWARINKIYFANTRQDAAAIQFDDEFLYQELTLPIDRRMIPMVQVDRDEALKVFNEWSVKSDKLRY